jgi:DNA polymerase
MSTSKKFNMQNMPRKPVFGVDFRRLLIARPGRTFLICDFDQIEARLLLWRVADTAFMRLLAQEGNLYQAYARQQGLYSGADLKEEQPDLYAYCKACVLSLGYGCGAEKFQATALSSYGVRLTDEQAEQAVQRYRAANPKVCAFWREHQVALQASIVMKDETHVVRLASGRALRYWHPRQSEKLSARTGRPELVAQFHRGGPFERIYGGLLVENEIQATARDVLRDAWLACIDAGLTVLWSVHDELVLEVLPEQVQSATAQVKDLAATATKTWAKGAPLSISVVTADRYRK